MSVLVPARRPAREILDDVTLPAEEMARSLRDLELVNEKWGGSKAIETHLLSRMSGGREERVVVLDVGAGSGAVTRALVRRLARAGHRATVVAVDLQWRHLAAGRAWRGGDLSALAADAFALPLANGAADWVVSTLMFHHFSPEENRALLREFARVSRRGFAILDLRRHLFPWIFVSIAGRIVFESRVSLLDGQTSVRQAYTKDEAREIAQSAVPGSRVERVFPFRLLISGPGS
ncbi:MAG: methyltransferase domain-containing protein [Acidobacteriota bacterium]